MAVIARPISARGLIGRAVGALRTGAAFNPVALPDLLAYYDIRQAWTLFQDTAGVTPVTAATDPIGRWDAVGPSGAPNLTQGTAPNRPLYQLTPTRAEFDLLDDSLSVTLPAISGGQIVIVSPLGIWIDSLTFAGGTFTVGPSTYTGGPVGLLSLLGGDVTAVYILDAPMSVDDQAALVAFEMARGSAGLITLGGEVSNDPSFDSSGAWTAGSGWSISGGQAIRDASSPSSLTSASPVSFAAGKRYRIAVDIASGSPALQMRMGGSGTPDDTRTYSPGVTEFFAVATGGSALVIRWTGGTACAINSISFREVILP